MNDTILVRCKHCGKELQIPAELTEFSCLYCGGKMQMAEVLPRTAPADPADLAYVREHLIDCIGQYPEYFKKFNRADFFGSFETYMTGIRPIFEAMDRYVCAKSELRGALLDGFAEQFLTDWESFHRKDKRWKNKTSRERMLFDDKLTLAWFTVPAIREFRLSVSEEFTERLQQRFVEKYPENVFQRTTFTEISEGFRRRRLCFITTAVCEYEGKPDDCAELTAFRSFRDGWLSQTAEGQKQTEEYYRVAPLIVCAIDNCDDRDKLYRRIRRDYLTPCYHAIQAGDYPRCRDTYTKMVRYLQTRYHIS